MKKLILSVVLIFFLIFPFFYFNFAASYLQTANTFYVTIIVIFNYLLIFVSGFLFSVFCLKYLYPKINSRSRNIFLKLLNYITVSYGVLLLLVTYSRFNRFLSESVDLMYYHFTVWQLSEFKIPLIWDNSNRYVWGDHFEPILIFFVPIYWVVKNAELIFLVQAIFVLTGAIPIYFIARKLLHSRFTAIAISFSYLAFGGVQYGYEYGFHPIMFFPTVFFWCYYFYSCRNLKVYLIFVFLSLLVKEEVAFILLFWGIYILLIKRDRLYGFSTILFSFLWYILCFNIIFPYFTKGAGFVHWGQYGGGLAGLLSSMLFNPIEFVKTLITPTYKIETIFHVFGSFSFLPFIFPPTLIIVIPSLLEKLLSSNIAAANGAHYSAAIGGVIIIASIESVQVFIKYKFLPRFINRVFVGLFIFYVALFSSIIYGYFAFHPLIITRADSISDKDVLFLRQTIQALPSDKTVSAQYQLIPHIQRPLGKIWVGPRENEKADYVIVNVYLSPVLTTSDSMNKQLASLDKRKDYELIVNMQGTVVFKKKGREN